MGDQQHLPSSFDGNEDFYEESRWKKITKKIKDEPLIPFGCALTCYALYRASRSIRSGDHHQTNRMFRARIYAQFFTIVCMIGGSYYYAEEREKKKIFESKIAQKQVMEKREAWIKELEARDEEDRQIRAKKQAEKERKTVAQGLRAAKETPAPAGPAAVKVGEEKARVEKGVASSVLEEMEGRRFSVVDAVRDLSVFRR